MSAYVEVVFDNTDGRMMGRGQEVVVRRTVGMKKDEYSLDKKSSSKQEIANLLETAGFSPSNPYYIVPQGRVTTLTNARDGERLKLLKEVAGTEVYENKRSRSLNTMAETQTKREQIDESLGSIREQMEELERETRVLKEFQEKDREKRCLDYTILQRELTDVQNMVNQIEEDMNDNVMNNTDQGDRLQQLEEHVQQLETQVAEFKERKQAVEFEKKQAEQDLDELIAEHARTEVQLNEQENNRATAGDGLNAAVQEIQNVENEIQSSTSELENVSIGYNQLKQQENELKNQLNALVTRKNHLQMKQGKSAQFKNKKEHDDWHKSEIDSLQKAIDQRTQAIENIETDIQDAEEQLLDAGNKNTELQQRLDQFIQQKKNFKHQEAELDKREFQLNDEKKALWREQNSIQSRLDTAKSNFKAAEQRRSETMDRATSQGLKSVSRIVKRLGMEGVYGTLGELITMDDKFKVAVEIVAGASLFHVIVDTDETAQVLMEELKRERAGRVTFVPLSRLDIQEVEYPQADETTPLINKIQFDQEYRMAMLQVFGKTMLCKNLDLGQQVARPAGLNAITLQGDRLDNRGLMTGGYTDIRKSRMDATRRYQQAEQEVEEREAEFAEVKKQVQRKEQEITKLLDERYTLNNSMSFVDNADSVHLEISSNTRLQNSLKSMIEQKRQSLEDKKSDLTSLRTELENHQSDITAGFNKNLSPDEHNELDTARSRIPSLQTQFNEICSQVSNISTTKSNLEFSLNETLVSRKNALQSRISRLEDETADQQDTSSLSQKLNQLEESKNRSQRNVEEFEQELESIEQQISNFEQQVSEINNQQLQIGRLLEKQRKKMDSRMARKAEVTQRKEEVNAKIRELGIIPEEAWDKYKEMASNDIIIRNRALGEELKGYSYVNKKALEQYNNFRDKRDELEERRAELVKSEESITELIDTLDQRKDEAIAATFRKVSKSFEEVFKKLVPAGTGRLIMQRRSDDSSQSQTPTQMVNGSSIENYTGVSIAVSFNSEHDEQLRIEQLSGGQKSLCALTLIFAIQMCDPAPFYLFDEVDANLDTQYRTAVAEMIKGLSQNGQFICTTFRPEMIEVANEFYGVSFKDSMSSISQISREEAAQFIEGATRM